MGFNQRFLKQYNAMSSRGVGKEEVLIAVFLPYLLPPLALLFASTLATVAPVGRNIVFNESNGHREPPHTPSAFNLQP